MKVATETRTGPACMIGRRTIHVVEKRQTISSGTGVFLTAVPVGIWVTEEGVEYFYPLDVVS